MDSSRSRSVRVTGLGPLALAASLTVAACHSGSPAPAAPPVAAASASPAPRAVATIRDVMDGLIDPSADFIWDAVQIEATRSGTTQRAPSTDDEWAAVRRHALTIAEAGNLLLIPNRRVAAGPVEAPAEGSMDLPPGDIEKLLATDPAAWAARVDRLQESALAAIRAADARDVQALLAAGETLDAACEACHSTFWYPPRR